MSAPPPPGKWHGSQSDLSPLQPNQVPPSYAQPQHPGSSQNAYHPSNQPKFAPGPNQPAKPVSFAHTAAHSSSYNEGIASGLYGSIVSSIGTCIGLFGSIPCCFCFPNPYRTVQQGSVGLFTRFGKYTRTVDPGLHYVNLMTESLKYVDVKQQIADIPKQNVITKDNVSVFIDSVLYYQVVNPYVAYFTVQDVRLSLIERTMTTLRQVIGSHDLQDVIVNRELVAHEIEKVIVPPSESWGVRVESVLIKDVQFSQELQENLSAAAKQRRLGASKIIAAQAEVEAAKLLREASDILNTPAAMQMRYLDTLKAMAHESQAKVIFMPPSFNEMGGTIGGVESTSNKSKGKDSKNYASQFGMDNAAVMAAATNL